MAADMNFRVLRRLVRGAHTGKLLDGALPRLLIQTLWISLFRNLDGHIHKDLYKWQVFALFRPRGGGNLVQLPCRIPIPTVGRNKRRNGHRVAVRKELRDLGDPTDILVAVLLGEAQVLVEAEPHVVAVEPVCGRPAAGEQLVLELDGDGGFAGRGEPCEPDCQAALGAEAGAFVAGEGRGVVGYVAGGCVRWEVFIFIFLVMKSWS